MSVPPCFGFIGASEKAVELVDTARTLTLGFTHPGPPSTASCYLWPKD